ncbi:MAG TPA: YggT family protein, partial [Syntrophomonadaceae bacterium]|nr:YggT family protein [Syntrophomonadaceae bacterium]
MSYQIVQVVDIIFEVLVWMIIARCVLSFVRHDPRQPVIRFIYDVTEPVMAPFRRIIPSTGGLDFSPIIAVLAVEFVRRIVLKLIILFLS